MMSAASPGVRRALRVAEERRRRDMDAQLQERIEQQREEEEVQRQSPRALPRRKRY